MPDREKVFDALRNCITEPKCKDCPWEDCERVGHKKTEVPVTLLLDALELLKEQEPVEPIKEPLAGSDYAIWQCGNCKAWLRITDRFCGRCGKAVKRDAAD